MAAGSFDFEKVLTETINTSAGSIDLKAVLTETINRHSHRKACVFRPDAVEWMMKQPEWIAFINKLEEAEIECAETA